MIAFVIGTAITLSGVYAARGAVERWNLTALQAVCLGWALGMLFVLGLLGLAFIASEAA